MERLSGRDILAVAAEAGIAPEYVRQAAEKVQQKQPQVRVEPQDIPTRSRKVQRIDPFAIAFLLVQFINISGLMYGRFALITMSSLAPASLALAFLLGLTRSARQSRDWGRLILRSSFFIALLCGVVVRLKWGGVNSAWWPDLPIFVLVQLLAAAIGSKLSTLVYASAPVRDQS